MGTNLAVDDLTQRVAAQIEAQLETAHRDLREILLVRGQNSIRQRVSATQNALQERIAGLESEFAGQLGNLARLTESSESLDRHIDTAAGAVVRALEPAPQTKRAVPRTKPLSGVLAPYNCPKCSCERIRAVKRDGFYEYFLRLFFIKPLQCRKCFWRFYRP